MESLGTQSGKSLRGKREGLLAGVRIVELGHVVAAPFTTSLCADFGATVIKIEDPKHGDSLRTQGPDKNGKKLWWKVAGRNKTCITLNLKDPRGLAICKKIIGGADALVENFRPGVLARLGLSNSVLRQINPRLIVLSISGYGQTGPYAERPGFGKVAEAMSGIIHLTGDREGAPRPPGVSLADTTTGLMGAFALMMALYNRAEHNGPPATIDVGLFETLGRMLDWHIILHDQLGLIPQRSGGKMPIESTMLNDTYRAADGKWMMMSASPAMLSGMIGIMNVPTLIDDPRFSTVEAAGRNVADFSTIIGGWIAQKKRDDAIRLLSEAGATCGPIYDVTDIVKDPQFQARGGVCTVQDVDLGPVRMVGVVPTIPEAPGEIRWTGPELGQHTNEVLRVDLGMSEQEIANLSRDGVI